jgi:hypothetical protein
MTNTPEKKPKSGLQKYDPDAILLIRWLRAFREALKRPVNVTFAALLIGIGATSIAGTFTAFWQTLMMKIFETVAQTPPESETIQATRIIVGFAVICLGVFVLFKKKEDRIEPPESPSKEQPEAPDENDPARPIQEAPSPTAGTLSSIDATLPVFIEILSDNGQYTGGIHQGCIEKKFFISSLALRENDKPIPDKEWRLLDLVEAIVRFKKEDLKAFDERVQLDLGQYLYDQTLGRLPEKDQKQLRAQKDLSLRILTENEWIAGLPWNLLADGGFYFSANDWSIALCQRIDPITRVLPPSPRMLIIAPEPPGLNRPTRSEEHLEELEDMLSSHDPRMSFGDNIKAAKTWEDFLQLATSFEPELIYYYGHGIGDRRITRLVFETGSDRKPVEKPVLDIAQCLRQLETPPLLAYINCCLGDSGGFLGAGFQLGEFIPAVVTNRTFAEVPVARAQAMTLWKNILLQAIPPHKAVSHLYADMDLNLLTTKDCRWITPVFHAHYGEWKAKPPTPPDRLTADPHWHLKIDRVRQYNDVFAQTEHMIREQKPKSRVFVWYGEEGQGVEIFHKRLLVELREGLSGVHVHQIRPRWPEHLEDYHSAFSHVLTEPFGVGAIEDIPVRLRKESHNRTTLLYVRHEPVRSDQLIDTETLKDYVLWWDFEFAKLLEKKQFALLSVSFLVENPPKFAQDVHGENIEELNLRNTEFMLLDAMEKVAKIDLLRFLRTHNIDMPEDRREEALQEIINRTDGRYEQTVEELKQLRKQAWRVIKRTGKKALSGKKT